MNIVGDKYVSVIIPTFNRADCILQSIESVLNQTYCELEVIVVDDGSSDNTEAIVNSIEDERVRYIALNENSGPARARNEGVKAASYDWIAFHDSDDCWLPEKLEKQMRYLEEHEEYSMVYCGYKTVYNNEVHGLIPSKTDGLPLEGDMFVGLLVKNKIGAPTMVINKEKFIEVGGFDDSFKCIEDWEFVIRYAKNNLIGFVDDYLLQVNLRSDGVSRRVGEYFSARCRILRQYVEDYVENNILDDTISELVEKASKVGVLELFEKMFDIYFRQ